MSNDLVVTIAEVRALANSLCDAIEARGQTAARFDARQYWTVYFEDMFHLETPVPVVGDVADDLAGARGDLLAPEVEPVVWHAAHHLAGLFNALACSDLNGTLTR
jgi:hypothetical protein